MKARVAEGGGVVAEGRLRNMLSGYRADRLEIEPRDVDDMLRLLERSPEELERCLRQLRGRFRETSRVQQEVSRERHG